MVLRCTTFDDLTPNATFERVVIDLDGPPELEFDGTKAHANVLLSFRERITNPEAKVWFDNLDDEIYAGLRIRVIQCSNVNVSQDLLRFSNALNASRQQETSTVLVEIVDANGPTGEYEEVQVQNIEHRAADFTVENFDILQMPYRSLVEPIAAGGIPANIQNINFPSLKVYDQPLKPLLETRRTVMRQDEDLNAIIKSFEMNVKFATKNIVYPNRQFLEENGREHLSYFAFVYLDLTEVMNIYPGLENIDPLAEQNRFPYGQISYINALPGVGRGGEIVSDLRHLRGFREQVSVSRLYPKDILSETASNIRDLTGRITRKLINQNNQAVSIPVGSELDKLSGRKGHYSEMWHCKDQEDSVRFMFGVDVGRIAEDNILYPILIRKPGLVNLAMEDGNAFVLRDMKVSKIRLRHDSKQGTALAGGDRIEKFADQTDYEYVVGLNDSNAPLFEDRKMTPIIERLEEETRSQYKFYSGKDYLAKKPSKVGKYKYKVEATFFDRSPEIIKSLADRLGRISLIFRRAHNELAGRHVFNQDFVSGEDQPGAIATQTEGGFFLREEGKTLVEQQFKFNNLRDEITAPVEVLKDVCSALGILLPPQEGIPNPFGTQMSRLLGVLLNQITPDSDGTSLDSLEIFADLASFMEREFRESINRSLPNFTQDEYRGTRSSGTGSDIVGGKRIIKDSYVFDTIVENLTSQETGIDFLSSAEEVEDGFGIKVYDYGFYEQRINAEISKYYMLDQAPDIGPSIWSFLTPSYLKMAGRRENISPLLLGLMKDVRMYSYDLYADFQADLYDYKFNAPKEEGYHVHQPSYASETRSEDRTEPEDYSRKTVIQLLNHHCEIEIDALDEKHVKPDRTPYDPKLFGEIDRNSGKGGIEFVFGNTTDTASEASADALEKAFGDGNTHQQRTDKDIKQRLDKNPLAKKATPMVTRIFYTLMGEMVLNPDASEYALAKFNDFARQPELTSSPLQLQAIRDMSAYRRGQPAVTLLNADTPYNQPFVQTEPYLNIPEGKNMTAIVDQTGENVTLFPVYDIMKDHSKFTPFWYNFKKIYKVEYLSGFENSLKEPVWSTLENNNPEAYNRPLLCRLSAYVDKNYFTGDLSATRLPVYNKYFFLDVKKEIKDSDAVFGTPGLSDDVSSTGITIAEGRGGQADNLERPTHFHDYVVDRGGSGFTTDTEWAIDYTGDGADIEPAHMHRISDMLVLPSRNPWDLEDHAHTLSVGRSVSPVAGHIPRDSNLQDNPTTRHTHEYFFDEAGNEYYPSLGTGAIQHIHYGRAGSDRRALSRDRQGTVPFAHYHDSNN